MSEERLHDFRRRIAELSGSGKRVVNTRRNGIYTSFTLPGLDDMLAVRDTRRRLADSGVPLDLTGMLAIDVGSNVGAVALELARRGAIVTGLEFRDDRVSLSEEIARHYELSASFLQMDFNTGNFGLWCDNHQAELVWCSSVDEYVADRELFYHRLRGLVVSGGTLYLESNIQDRTIDEVWTLVELGKAGFDNAEYLGNGHSGGISRRRKLFRAS